MSFCDNSPGIGIDASEMQPNTILYSSTCKHIIFNTHSITHDLSFEARATILNMSDPRSVKKVLPEEYNDLRTLVSKGNGVITVKTPFSGILRNPGCYVCRSTLMDESGTAILQWRWWFELRARTKEIEKAIQVNTILYMH